MQTLFRIQGKVKKMGMGDEGWGMKANSQIKSRRD
jgi:hypothetical protein